jgi:DNA-binding GntR family transcriptional regulator
MEQNLDSGKYTVDQLDKLTEKVLAHQYGASRETVRKARNAVLQERGDK